MGRLSCIWLLCASTLLSGCPDASNQLVDRTVKVGCGMCRFEVVVPGAGCYWATKMDGRVLPIRGDVLPKDHENHAPDGMCNVTRDAVLSGTRYETYIAATRFDLQPAEGAATPRFTPDDEH